MKIVILYSGGLDSYCMYQYAKFRYPEADIQCVYFRHGSESEKEEVKNLPDFVDIRNIDWIDNEITPVAKKSDPFAGNIYVPGRNFVFATLASCIYLPDEIWLGVLYDEDNDQATDKNKKFREGFEDVSSYVLSPFSDGIKLRFPFVENKWTKLETVGYLLDNDLIDPDYLINNTSSCWHYVDGKLCGQCKQCLKRSLVLRNFGLEDVNFIVNPLSERNDVTQKLMESYLSCENPNLDETAMIRLILAYKSNNKIRKIFE